MKKNILNKVILLAVMFTISTLFAMNSRADDSTRQGIAHTQEQLKNPDFRLKNVKESKEAAALDQQIKGLTNNPETEQQIYELAAEVMGNMKDLTPEQMAEFLQKVQNNPSAFAESFSAAQKSKLHDIADRIPAAKAK